MREAAVEERSGERVYVARGVEESESLCHSCANRHECPILEDLDTVCQSNNVGVAVGSCPHYEGEK